MRILLVIDGMHPRDGGPPAVVAGSARALQQLGHSVTVLTTVHLCEEDIVKSTWQPMVDAGAEFIFWQQVGALQLLTSGNRSDELFELIKAYDVVHLHSFWSPIAILAARAAYEVGKPYFVSTHGVLDHRAMWRTSFKYFKKRIAVALLNVRAMLRRASGVVFGSEAEATQSWNIEPAMLRLFIPNGVDPDSVDSPVSASDRKRLKQVAPTIEQWDRTLLFLARIHPEKGLDMLVRAFSLISTEFPNAGLLVAGLKQDAQFQTLVENLVAEAPDPDRIAFTTELTGPTCKFLYKCCDAYVLPSHAEGFSVALTEALANGRPSLITTFCHMPEVEEHAAGFIVDPETSAIAEGLRRLLSLSSSDLDAMGRQARALYEKKYTWSRVAETLESAYLAASKRHEAVAR